MPIGYLVCVTKFHLFLFIIRIEDDCQSAVKTKFTGYFLSSSGVRQILSASTSRSLNASRASCPNSSCASLKGVVPFRLARAAELI